MLVPAKMDQPRPAGACALVMVRTMEPDILCLVLPNELVQLLPNQNLLDRLHRGFEQARIRGRSVVYVYFSVDVLVDCPELIGKELCGGLLIAFPTMGVRKVSFDNCSSWLRCPAMINLCSKT